MPVFQDTVAMETHSNGGQHFQFSAVPLHTLGASEYTLGVVCVDVSGSVLPYAQELSRALQEVVKACRQNPRADNMMLRVILFNSQIQELHGFKPLPSCNEADYVGALRPGGMTSLFDAVCDGINSVVTYGKTLTDHDYAVNAALFVITDGDDTGSTLVAQSVADALKAATQGEAIESIMPVLIGVNTGAGGLNQYLQNFKDRAGFQQYVAIDKADEKTLAKLGGFISRSMSSQSQALGSGGASQSLTF